MNEHVLDNPLWHMFCHNLVEFAAGTALAKRGDANIVPVAALANHSAAAFRDIANLFDAGESADIAETHPPQQLPGFEITDRFPAYQLVCQQRTPVLKHDAEILELTTSDAKDMIQLVELTNPGPFFPGLLPMRRFVGIRQNGHLIAMAGERIKVPGYCEISAVCTHPDWRGRGYATLLTSVIADGIWERGETPFLHVLPENTPAYRVYEALHFVKRGVLFVMSVVRS